MSHGYASILQPHRQWSLWAVFAGCTAWLGVIIGLNTLPAGAIVPFTSFFPMIFPPIIAALFALSLIRVSDIRPVLDSVEQRLMDANTGANTLAALLISIDAMLSSCVDRTTKLSESVSDQGTGLIASAALLTAAAAEIEQSGTETDGIAARLSLLTPGLQQLCNEINAMAGRLDGDMPRHLQAIDAMLGTIQIRGDEIATQADTAIVSMNKQLADVDEQSRQTTTLIAKRAYALDAAVDGALERASTLLNSVSEQVAAQMAILDDRLASARATLDAVGGEGAAVIGLRIDGLLAAGGQLSAMLTAAETQSIHLRQLTDDHLDTFPAQILDARREGDAMFDHLGDRVETLRTDVANLETPFIQSRAMVEAMLARMGDVRTIAADVDATLGAALPVAARELSKLDLGMTILTERVAKIHEALAAGEQATRQVGALVDETRVELAAMGDADLRMVDDRLNATVTMIHDIGRQITAIVPLSGTTKSRVEEDLASLNDRLYALQRIGNDILIGLSGEVAAVHGMSTDLSGPLTVAKTLLDVLNEELGRIDIAAGGVAMRIDMRAEAATTRFTALEGSARNLLDETTALQAATSAGSRAIDTAAESFARERIAFDLAATTLSAKFDQARGVLDEISATSIRVAAETAANLGPVFDRAHELASAAEAKLRDMLASVIAEAETRLEWSSGAIAEEAFGTPIRLELASIEDAAGRAIITAETTAARIAGQARALSALIDGVDVKVGEIETRLDVRARDTLSTRSSRLIAMLGDASVDIARLLAVDAGDKAWLAYRKGDRSIFARRTVRLIDRQSSQKIARHFAHDSTFNEEASHYLSLFEQLTGRLDSDPDGDALLGTIVSSDFGKLYVAIARATGRWEPIV